MSQPTKSIAATARPGGLIARLTAAPAVVPRATPAPLRARAITAVKLPPEPPANRRLQPTSARAAVYAEVLKRAKRSPTGEASLEKVQASFPDFSVKGHIQKLCASGHLLVVNP